MKWGRQDYVGSLQYMFMKHKTPRVQTAGPANRRQKYQKCRDRRVEWCAEN